MYTGASVCSRQNGSNGVALSINLLFGPITNLPFRNEELAPTKPRLSGQNKYRGGFKFQL